MSTLLAGAAAWMPFTDLEILADLGAVIYAFDDLVDEGDITAADAAFRGQQLASVAASQDAPEVAFDPMANLMRSIAARLSGSALMGTLSEEWARVTSEMFEGMAAQRYLTERLRAGHTLALSEVLDVGRRSVGVECVAFAACIALEDTTSVSELRRFIVAARRFSLAARIANDLRSASREREEDTVNPLFLPGVETSALESMLRAALAEGRLILAPLVRVGAPAARFLEAFATGLVAVYAQREMHDEPTIAA
ncbi:MAG: terpene synthase family protein [Polyangiaceae bacterium]